MARGKKNIEGQLSFDFSLNSNNYVCQSNTLISGRQALKLNSAKLIRAAIMQIKYDDTELKPYVITIADLSELYIVILMRLQMILLIILFLLKVVRGKN